MSDGSQSNLAYVKEITWGVTPVSQFTSVNFDSEDIKLETKDEQAKNVRPDRQSSGLIRKAEEVTGGFESEFRANDYDELMAGFLWDAWVSPGTLTGTVDFATEVGAGVGGIITFDAGDTINILVDQYISLPSAVNAANQGPFRVKAISGNDVTVDSPLVDELGTTTVVKGDRLRNGVTRSSYSIEKQFTDISEYILNKGMTPDVLELNVENEESVMIKFAFAGKTDAIDSSTASSPAATAISNEPVFVSGNNVANMEINGVAMASCQVQSFNISFGNQVTKKTGVGSISPCGQDGKTIALTGSITSFFEDSDQYTLFKNSTSFVFAFDLVGPNGDTYIFRLPACKYSELPTNVSGKEEYVLSEGSFESGVGSEDYTMQICRMLT